jgi:hypothetical protein
MIPALIAGGSALIGAISSAKANKDANKTNQGIADRNYAMDKEGLDFRKSQYADSLKGFSDSFGNRQYFDPIRGWVSEANPQAVARNQGEQGVSNNLLAELAALRRRSPQEVERERILGATAGFNTGYDDNANKALIAATRAGPGTLAQTSSNLATDRGKALADVLMRAKSGAYGQSYDEYNSAGSGLANLYAAMSERAAGRNTMPAPGATAGLSTNIGNQLGATFGNIEQPYVMPDNAIGSGIASAGAGIAGAYDMYNQTQQQNRLNDALIEAMRNRSAGNQL